MTKSQFLKPILLIWIVFMSSNLSCLAQNDDSMYYRTNHVKKVESWVHFLQFENSNDTCLYEIKDIDSNGLVTYMKQDYHCHGWDVVTETSFEYDKKGRPILINALKNDNVMALTKLRYDDQNRLIREETQTFDPYATTINTNTYFGKVDKPDSMISIEVTNGDTTIFRSAYTYNKSGLQTRVDVVDRSNNKPYSSRVQKYNSKSQMVRDEYLMFQVYDNDQISLFTYNEEGRVASSKSELFNTAAEFWYLKNGLLTRTYYYNKFETLEREVFHKYEFYEQE